MKRKQMISDGVFEYSTGQIGTIDLPIFIAECAYHRAHDSKRRRFYMSRVSRVPTPSMSWRGQLARAYAQYKTANKRNKA